MPKLWSQTIEAHRRSVHDATLDAAAALVAERGVASVTMAEIAERTGIGRATLYKYFADIDAILAAWHERQVSAHLGELAAIAGRPADPVERLEAVLEAYAFMSHARHGGEVAAALHSGEHVAKARRQLRDFASDLVAKAAATGVLRGDVSPDELACYCLSALGAARELHSRAAVRRLVAVTLSGLRPPT